MSIEISGVEDHLVTVRVTKTLTKAELARAHGVALDAIGTHGTIRILVITTEFLGWSRDDDWSDVSFPSTQDRHIQKIAVVGDKRWEDEALAFLGKGFRPVAIEYFLDLGKARAWLRQ